MKNNGEDKIEVGDILRKYGREYRAKYKSSVHQIKIMNLLSSCRTKSMGSHIEKCDNCGHQRICYNSCRNRHCPKCRHKSKEKWLEARKKELLPVEYYHIVFTIPEALNQITLINKREMYGILFQSASETLLKLGKDPKHLGGEIGIISVLHTWGQNLNEHPHLHCIVTGGGLERSNSKWVKPKKTKRKNFFIHVNIISDLFKKKYLYYFKKKYKNNNLLFTGSTAGLESRKEFQKLLNGLYSKKWITYCKRPFGGPEQVLDYLGRYTHRVAISNNRIVKVDEDQVSFTWKDYRCGNKNKEMRLTALEFIRRFMLHVLPENFYKIRYYGILSSRNKKKDLAKCLEILNKAVVERSVIKETSKVLEGNELDNIEKPDIYKLCPNCKSGTMHCIRINIRAA